MRNFNYLILYFLQLNQNNIDFKIIFRHFIIYIVFLNSSWNNFHFLLIFDMNFKYLVIFNLLILAQKNFIAEINL